MRRVLLATIAVVLSGCASAQDDRLQSALDQGRWDAALQVYEREPDPGRLSRFAREVLARAALSDDRQLRRAALVELRLAGAGALPVWRRLAGQSRVAGVRAQALSELARRGEPAAESELLALRASADAAVLAAVALHLDPEEDAAELLELLGSPDPELRAAAARRLSDTTGEPRVLPALQEVARRDPDARVRVAALAALGERGPGALPAIEGRLQDEALSVRLAAVRAMVSADVSRAVQRLSPYLQASPSALGIETARAFVLHAFVARTPHAVEPAIAFLRRALDSFDAAVRARAAVALDSLPLAWRDLGFVADRLRDERHAEVRLTLASLLVEHGGRAREGQRALRELLDEGGVVGAQAAAALARLGDREVIDRLARWLADELPLVRRIAVRALARSHPHRARKALTDRALAVRLAGASAILRAG